jgi:hypothetical protein
MMTRVFVGGAVGTAVMTFMMYFVRPVIVGQPMDIAAKIGSMMGNNWALGMTVHLVIGAVIVPLIYAMVFYKFLPGPPVLKGILTGIALWLLTMTVTMPMMGDGFFLSATGDGPKAVVAAFMVHAIYGALIGKISGNVSES